LAIAVGMYFNIVFVIAGIAMGYYYAYGKSVDINGESYFDYNEKVKQRGSLILFADCVVLLIQITIIGMQFL